MTVAALWTSAFAVLAALVAWALLDLAGIAEPGPRNAYVVLLGAAVVLLAFGMQYSVAVLRRLAIAGLALTYFAAHAFWLRLDLLMGVGYLTALLVLVELLILAGRFAPLYRSGLTSEEGLRIRAALVRSVLRLFLVSAMAFLLPVLAADLALSGAVPLTTIPTAILLATALVAVVVLLALLPILGRRTA